MKILKFNELFESMNIVDLKKDNKVGFIEFKNDKGEVETKTFDTVDKFLKFKKKIKTIISYINLEEEEKK